jgi:hypothetical protein
MCPSGTNIIAKTAELESRRKAYGSLWSRQGLPLIWELWRHTAGRCLLCHSLQTEATGNQSKSHVAEAARSTALLSSPVPGNTRPTKSLSTPRQKNPAHNNPPSLWRRLKRLNKDFNAKCQPIGFTTYRITYQTSCQTCNFHDYLNLQNFLKQNEFH